MTLRGVRAYHTPENQQAVVELLSEHGDGALIVAGGSFVHGLIARGLLTELDGIVDVGRLPLAYVRSGADGVRIGATTRFIDIQRDPGVQSSPALGALRDALAHPPQQVLNAATVGGCVAASCPFFDVPIALLALDARVTAFGTSGERTIALADFFTGLFDNALADGEIVTEVHLPAPAGRSASGFAKLEANANDLAILNAAASVSVDREGRCTAARIFVGGGVGETPVRAVSAEQALIGQPLTEASCSNAGRAGRDDVTPISDHRATASYRSSVVAPFIKRALLQARARLA